MYHKLVTTIQELLKENGMWFETFEHEPVKTSEEAAQQRIGYTIKQGAKALLLKVKPRGDKTKFIMCVLPGDRRLSSARVKSEIDLKEIRFATQDEVYRITGGVVPGGLPRLVSGVRHQSESRHVHLPGDLGRPATGGAEESSETVGDHAESKTTTLESPHIEAARARRAQADGAQ